MNEREREDLLIKVVQDNSKNTELLSRIMILLTGNKHLDRNDNGLIGLINEIKDDVSSLKKWRDRALWIVIGMSFPAGVGTWELISNIIKH
jgi:hypothetical protein